MPSRRSRLHLSVFKERKRDSYTFYLISIQLTDSFQLSGIIQRTNVDGVIYFNKKQVSI